MIMEKSEILNYVSGVILENVASDIEREDIKMDSRFVDLGAESLEVLLVVFTIEQEKNITFPTDVVYHLRTVGELVDYISSAQK